MNIMTETRKRTEYMKQYDASRKEQKKVYNKQYNITHVEEKKHNYEKNKEAISKRVNQHIVCDVCGCQASIHNLPRHKRSKKCQSFVKE